LYFTVKFKVEFSEKGTKHEVFTEPHQAVKKSEKGYMFIYDGIGKLLSATVKDLQVASFHGFDGTNDLCIASTK